MITAPTPPGDEPPATYDYLAPCFYNLQAFLYVHLAGKAVGLHGFSTSVHNACASGAFAVEVAAQRIQSGQADAMIVVGGEAFDTAVRLEWFRRLDLYAHDEYMRPFDAESSGFYVGEGAAAIVLESAEHAAGRGAEPYARYLGGAFAHQGWKQAVPDVRSARLRDVICQALTDTGVAAGELDLIVPHGASTLLGDGYEASCLAQALDKGAARAVATVFKPYVGHMLAASGIVELICAMLALKHDTIPATLHSRPQHVQLPLPLATKRLEQPVKTVLKLSNGFTGHDAASLFGKV
jgi:3-oxoacyl-(acyl-carrier-protein) synthase